MKIKYEEGMKSNFFEERLANDKNITLLYSVAKTKY